MHSENVLERFHPAVRRWFTENIGTPSEPQILGWPEIQAGKNVLISAPTGAGKTLAAFLESINYLLKSGLEDSLPDGVFILYVSPLKALNNDIYKNLDIPLEGIKKECEKAGLVFPDIRKAVRTGDTPQNERQRMLKKPPHILITTPESLYLMLTSKKASAFLKNVRYLIVDEIHTMLGTKRGVHLALSIGRLEHLTGHELVRIGLSATVNPIESAANYLGGLIKNDTGYIQRPVSIIAPRMERNKDLSIHMPVSDYRALEQGSIWPEIYDSIFKLVQAHKSTIVFVNNRAVAERVAANLNSMTDEVICRPHHGSLSKSKRLEVEDEFKTGKLTCIIATSTLELGIDVGSVDLMIQVASPTSVSSGLQRLGRAGHRLSAVSKGRILPKTRGDLLRSAFITQQMLEGNIEKEKIPLNCLDILAQHIVSMSCEGQWTEDEMLAVIRPAWSYKDLKEADFRRVLSMLAGDFEHQEDIPAKPRIIWDRQNKTIEGTTYSRMLAVNSSGTIPDRGYFSVYLEDYKTRIGELDEVFVFEARLGDKFMLGNSAWKVQKIEKNRVIVAPTNSVGAKTPFWNGDGIGGPYEQGILFGQFLKTLSDKLDSEDFLSYLTSSTLLDETGAINIQNYLVDQVETIGCLSHDRRIVIEYFKDNEGDQKIVIHAHFGGRVNSVLAILMQKVLEDTIRCQAFASHSNDAILIHIYGCPDSISNVLSLLKSVNVESVMLDKIPSTSRFSMTFRYNAYRALMMGVRNLGQRLPLWLQRLRSADALENAVKYMDHPLLLETMRECLDEIFDIPNTIKVLSDIRSGKIEVVEKNTYFPSPFASELMFEFKSIMMYAEKDPHPGNTSGSVISGIDALNLSYHRDEIANPLNPEAIREITEKNNVLQKINGVTSGNELHSLMLIYGDITSDELPFSQVEIMNLLIQQKRALYIEDTFGSPIYIAAEEADLYKTATGIEGTSTWTEDEAINRIIRRYSRYRSPFTIDDIKFRYGFNQLKTERAIKKNKSDGILVTGHFLKSNDELCHVKIYEAIIRKESMIKTNEVVARDAAVYAAFLPDWQKVGSDTVSPETSLIDTIHLMEGLYLPIEYWETIVFPARVKGYSPALLDRICASGKVFWRISAESPDKKPTLAWYCIENLSLDTEPELQLESDIDEISEKVLHTLKSRGACFTHVLSTFAGIQSSELLEILERLVYKGLVVNDSFISIRYFLNKPDLSKRMNAVPERDRVLKARRVAHAVSKPEMGRWEIAWPIKEEDLQKLLDRWLSRYGFLSKEIFSLENSGFSWVDGYEALKLRDYAGDILRGYFFKGISGIQFMLPDAWQKLESPEDMQVINACDPSQVYGRIIPHSESELNFTNVPGTVIVMNSGKPVLVLERFGESISFDGDIELISKAAQAFTNEFNKKRVWPDRKKINVKYWPEEKDRRELLQTALDSAGFKSEIMKMILYRS